MLYFALEGLADRFVYPHYGLAAILVFLGTEFILQGFGVHLPIHVSLLFIAGATTISIVASPIATRGNYRRARQRARRGQECTGGAAV